VDATVTLFKPQLQAVMNKLLSYYFATAPISTHRVDYTVTLCEPQLKEAMNKWLSCCFGAVLLTIGILHSAIWEICLWPHLIDVKFRYPGRTAKRICHVARNVFL
jgi:hypothetical protein